MKDLMFFVRFLICLIPAILTAIIGSVAGVIYRMSDQVLDVLDRFTDWSWNE